MHKSILLKQINIIFGLVTLFHTFYDCLQRYVIDGVSCDGAHVVTAMWRYDRRAINGAGFVCCGQKLLGPDTPEANALRDYASSVFILIK